jgi:purine-binding chemotaxis protein CheW
MDLQELILADEAQAAPLEEGSAAAEPSALKQCLIFQLAASKYAIPAANLEELGYLPKITRVPNLPDWLPGVTAWRGQIIPVFDLRALLGQGPTEGGRMLVVKARNNTLIGLIVDQINTIASLSIDQLREPRPEDNLLPHINGTCEQAGQLIACFDVDSLLGWAESQQLDAV